MRWLLAGLVALGQQPLALCRPLEPPVLLRGADGGGVLEGHLGRGAATQPDEPSVCGPLEGAQHPRPEDPAAGAVGPLHPSTPRDGVDGLGGGLGTFQGLPLHGHPLAEGDHGLGGDSALGELGLQLLHLEVEGEQLLDSRRVDALHFLHQEEGGIIRHLLVALPVEQDGLLNEEAMDVLRGRLGHIFLGGPDREEVTNCFLPLGVPGLCEGSHIGLPPLGGPGLAPLLAGAVGGGHRLLGGGGSGRGLDPSLPGFHGQDLPPRLLDLLQHLGGSLSLGLPVSRPLLRGHDQVLGIAALAAPRNLFLVLPEDEGRGRDGLDRRRGGGGLGHGLGHERSDGVQH